MNLVHEYLQSGESLLWEGQPDPTRFSRRGLWIALPFGLVFTGFSLFWVVFSFALTRGVGAVSPDAPPIALFPLFGVPFVLVGLYILVGRLFVAQRQARSLWYAVTDRRVLIVGGRRPSLTELALTAIPGLQVDESDAGYGTIAFGTAPTMGTIAGMSGNGVHVGGTKTTLGVPAFQSIPHVRAVYDTIKRAQAATEGEDPYRRGEAVWESPRWPGRGGV